MKPNYLDTAIKTALLDLAFCEYLKFNPISIYRGFPGSTSGKEHTFQSRRPKRRGFNLWVRKIPWRGK